MKRWIFLMLFGCCMGIASAQESEQPSVLLILVDDLGPEWIGVYGAEGIETPNIDRLAAEGMRFTNAYSMPICTPTRATLLTGQYPWRHGWTSHWDVPRWGAGVHFDPTYNLTFARVLRAAGYRTAIAGKWQINDFRVQPDVLDQHGFDDWAMWTGFETGNPPSAERFWDPYIHTREGSRTYPDRFGPDVFTEFLIDFMREHRDEPMLLYFPMVLTHTPFVHTPLDPDADEQMEQQRAMVRYTDHLVGRLMDTLDELEIADNTIVIFTTDNGSTRGISNRMKGRAVEGGKGTLGENGVRQPFIVRAPGHVPAGVETDALMDFTDLFPTLVELAGTGVPDSVTVDGHSFAPLLRGDTTEGSRDWIMAMGLGFAEMTPEGVAGLKPYGDRAVRDKRYKLRVIDRQPDALFDLATDPAETTNLIESTDPEIAAAREKLEAVVATFPDVDAVPRYDPNPPQPWDRKKNP